MTRAKTEFAGALVGAVALVTFLAWYQGQRSQTLSFPEPATGTVMRAIPEPAALISGAAAGTALAGMPGSPLPAADVARDRAFINEAFPALSSWSVEEVKPLLSNAALNASTDQELADVMTTLDARLGTLQYFDPPQPVGAAEPFTYPTADASLQPYTFTAYFEAGEAEVNLVLEKQQQQSSLYSFDIHVPN